MHNRIKLSKEHCIKCSCFVLCVILQYYNSRKPQEKEEKNVVILTDKYTEITHHILEHLVQPPSVYYLVGLQASQTW